MDLYICHTPYHLLIAVIKVMISTNESDLVLCATDFINPDVVERLRTGTLFGHITEYCNLDAKAKELDYSVPIRKRGQSLRNQLDKWVGRKQLDYDNIFIFNDASVWGRWLNSHKIYYHLLEDGLNCFQLPGFLEYNTPGNPFKRAIKRRMGIDFANFGQSRFTKSVEVNTKDGILLRSKKVKEVPKKTLFEQLSVADKKQLVSLFLSKQQQQELSFFSKREVTLLITQPLSEDGHTDESGKLRLYQELLEQYAVGTVLIKTHPRENTDYEAYFPGGHILKMDRIPLEVLNFVEGFQIKRAITTYSTAIAALDFCKEHIILGYEETLKRLKGYRKIESNE